MVVLKRLPDALRDGDRILAVVRGTAVNQIDGLEHAIATGGTGVPTSAVLVGVDR